MVSLVYHPRYNITAFGLEKRHPFDSCKYQRIHDTLVSRGLKQPRDFFKPKAATCHDLSKIHTLAYLRSLRNSQVLAGILEVPVVAKLPRWLVNWRLLRPMRFAAGGTILACRLALENGIAINLGGGFHHAGAGWGGGFCIYADVSLAAKMLYDEGKVQKVLVVDLDAHQGNGTASLFHNWPWATIYDIYERDIFPGTKEPEEYGLAVSTGLSGEEYLTILQRTLPQAIDATQPDLVIYNAGSDPFQGDPLAGFRLSADDLAERDLYVISTVRERNIPVAMVLSGGYSRQSWKLHADAIEGILARFDK